MGSYRRRMLWPSIMSDPHVLKLPPLARWLFIAHVLAADDYGRGDLDAEDWKTFAFSMDADVDEDRVEQEFLPLLHAKKKKKKRALVEPYEVDGVGYWYLPKWSDYQRVDRPTPSKIPDPAKGDRPRGLPKPGKKRRGTAPSPEQWDMLIAMAEERETTVAKVAKGLGITSADDILARDVTAIRRALEEIKPKNGKQESERRTARLAREARVAVQLGRWETFADVIENVSDRDWPKVRAEILSLDSSLTGTKRSEVFDAVRKAYG